VRVEGEVHAAEELAGLPVRLGNAPPAELARISRARRDVPEPLTRFRIDGAPAVELEVVGGRSSGQLALARDIFGGLAGLRARLPPGMLLLVESDATAGLRELLAIGRRVAAV